jgi:hypothetical protein
MFSALCYLQYHMFRNRLVSRVKRLKQPKYLIGAIVGGLYFYWYFFRSLFRGYATGGQSAANLAFPPEHRLLIESLGALVLFVIVLMAWIVPHERAALTFTEAEVAFLFPAPVTRRTLIHFKLMRSQLRILFSVLFLTLFSRSFGGHAWIHAFGWWLILSTLNLHFLGSSFARTILLDRGISNWLRRWLIFGLVTVIVGAIWIWARRTMPEFNLANIPDFKSAMDYLQRVLTAGPVLYLLDPFRMVVRPFLAPGAAAFFSALPPVLLIFLLHYLWVIYSDVAFEEASVAASQKLAARMAAARTGNWQGARKNQKAKRPWFNLTPSGPAPVAFLWKNLIGVGQVFSPRLWIMLMVIVVVLSVSLGHNGLHHQLPVIMGVCIAFALGYSLLLGPQILRLDFRHDLPLADVLKTFPLHGWQIALGEILAPVAVLLVFQWVLLLIEIGLLFYLPGSQGMVFLIIALGAALMMPALDVLLLLIPNAAVLLFPAWIQTGKDSPRGVEVTGQRLIMALAQLLVLILALVPAAAAFAAVFFPLDFAVGPPVAVLAASLAGTAILAVEAGSGVMLLGKLFERFDVTEEHAG